MDSNSFVLAITRIEGDGFLDPASKALALAALAQEFAASTAAAAAPHVEAAKPAPEPLPSSKENVDMGVDDFSRDLRGQAHATPQEVDRTKLAATFYNDLVEVLVGKRTPERDAKYGPLWQGTQLPGAERIANLVADRQAATWDVASNMPTESLKDSIEYARYNSWTAGGNYIKDTLYSTGDPTVSGDLSPSDPGFRPKPGQPGYTGPYTNPSR